jgi:RimJ/RimL family protein N-acetyltransferase
MVVIETERLTLRPHSLDHYEARVAMSGNPYVMRFFGGMTHSREENWARILRYAGHWALLEHGLFAVAERQTGRFVGEVGLADFHRGLGEDFDAFPEGAWVLDEWAEGKGYATEAMRAAMDWHARSFGLPRAVCIIAPDNLPSLKVAEKLGFRPYREARYHERPVTVLERTGSLG